MLPHLRARPRQREAPHEAFQRRDRLFGFAEPRERALMLGGVDQADFSVLTYADAWLRRLDPAAADALQGVNGKGRLRHVPTRGDL